MPPTTTLSTGFALHPRLAADCHVVGDFPLSRLLLMNDASYPWFILVPRRSRVREIYELAEADQLALLCESVQLSRALMTAYEGHKLNLAALGNLVPQLHLHHIVRYTDDRAWPTPVFGRHPREPYTEAARADRLAALRPHLPQNFQPR